MKEDKAGARRLHRSSPGMARAMVPGQVELKDHFEVTVRYRRGKVACLGCSGMIVRGMLVPSEI
jgi:hypothetical protein